MDTAGAGVGRVFGRSTSIALGLVDLTRLGAVDAADTVDGAAAAATRILAAEKIAAEVHSTLVAAGRIVVAASAALVGVLYAIVSSVLHSQHILFFCGTPAAHL